MNRTRKENLPAPGHYNATKPTKALNAKFATSIKSPSFIDDAVYHSNQSPTLCYKKVEDLQKTKPKIFELKIINPTEKQEE